MLRRRLAGSALAVAVLAACPLARAGLSSTFDAGDEGWSVGSSQGTAGVGSFGWAAAGGNPGGRIQATDTGDQGGWWFVAPAAWAGDWSPYHGGRVSFDVFAMAGTDTTLNPPVEAAVFALADGGRLRAVQGAGAVVGQWVSVEIPLTAGAFTLTNSGYASFGEALAHVTAFVIPGDFVYRQQDSTRLDNVRVIAVPEPATWVMTLAGLMALVYGRSLRRRTRARRRDA